jgi:hypothetical protein
MAGIKVRDRRARSCVRLVPDMGHPRKEPFECPTCMTIHVVKTYHLWLDDTGAAIVSAKVLEGLKKAGMPELDVVEEVKNPPPVAFGPDLPRDKVDRINRRIPFLRKRWK